MTVPSTIFRDLAEVRLPRKPVHLAIGMFDGVHRGHQAVIGAAVEAARESDGVAGVFTLWPHPSRLFSPEKATPMIFSREERTAMLLRAGAGFVVEQAFTREFAAIEAEAFVGWLKQGLPNLTTIHVGENWKFGRGRRGDVALLARVAADERVTVVSMPRLSHDGRPISSSRIRQLLAAGDMESAAVLFGYPYSATGQVVPGRRLGRTIGFPTLNVDWRPELRPALGVYAVRVQAAGAAEHLIPGVANYGVRPTVGDAEAPLLEVHLLETCPFDAGDWVRVEWMKFLRPEQKFGSIDGLKSQIERDRNAAAVYFVAVKPPAKA